MRSRSAVRSATSRGVAIAEGSPSWSRMHGSSCRIFALCSPAGYSSTRAAQDMLAAGADLVALGRPFLANPDLVRRLRLGAPLNPVRDRYLMYVGGADGYTDYPALDAQAPSPSRDSIVATDGPRVA